VGLDRSFRIPFLPFRSPGTPEDTEADADDPKRRLSPFHVPLGHQLAILEAQIDIAIEHKRGISMHSVKAQQASVDLLKRLAERYADKFYAISFDFHSCGLSAETWGDIQVSGYYVDAGNLTNCVF
jgi:Tat protein secretion system quality control protein TatD with DNase activity